MQSQICSELICQIPLLLAHPYTRHARWYKIQGPFWCLLGCLNVLESVCTFSSPFKGRLVHFGVPRSVYTSSSSLKSRKRFFNLASCPQVPHAVLQPRKRLKTLHTALESRTLFLKLFSGASSSHGPLRCIWHLVFVFCCSGSYLEWYRATGTFGTRPRGEISCFKEGERER